MSKNQRIAVLGLLTVLLVVLFRFSPTRPRVEPNESAILFSSLFLLSFSALLLEHFFTRPTDVIAAGVSILLLLVPSKGLLTSWGAWYWALGGYALGSVLLATVALLLLTDRQGSGSARNRLSQVLKAITTKLAPGRVQYFFLFLLSAVFFIEPQTIPFVALLVYGGLVLLVQPQQLALQLPQIMKQRLPEVGELMSVQGKNTFLVRLHGGKARPALQIGDLLEFTYGMDEPPRVRRAILLERFFLDRAQWARALCHEEVDKQSSALEPLEQHRPDAVYKRADGDLGHFLGTLVGVVEDGTDIGTLRFLQAGQAIAEEGDLVQVQLKTGPVLYQVVNARVDTESLESRNEADYVIGEAVQLGLWRTDRGAFERYGWVPPARTPVTRATTIRPPAQSPDEIVLGHVPGTDFPVLLNRAEAISHHTAILGVTGAGKSVFARDLIKRFATDDLRVIVVDFTREWHPRMHELGADLMMTDAETAPIRAAIETVNLETSKFKSQQDTNLIKQEKKIVYEGFKNALTPFLQEDNARVRIFELPDLSNTEGVLEYTQWFFKTLFRIARDSHCFGKRVCVVLEEAHTVIPEWNFVGLSDRASQSLVNNISQIALQGRKYNVGFIIIAQRTATVSKTVLTQCNTLLAFQCFDGTSIEFLSHYLPKPMVAAIPNLRFRRVIAAGKAIRGSVPLLFDVPEIEEAAVDAIGPE